MQKWLQLIIKTLPKYHRYIPSSLVFVTGISLSVIASLLMWRWEQAVIQKELQQQLDQVATGLQKNINSSLEVVQATGALYSASNNITLEEFQKFVKPALYRHSNIQAIAWLPRISNHQKLALKIDSKSQPQISPQELFPIAYIAPLEGHEMLIGQDFLKNTAEGSSLIKFKDKAELFVTGKADFLKIGLEKQTQILSLFPVPQNNYKSKSKGFVLGIFQIDELVKNLIQEIKLDRINFYLEDLTAPENYRFLAFYKSQGNQVINDPQLAKTLPVGQRVYCPDGSACTRILNIENRRWLLRFLLTPDYLTWDKHWRVAAILTIGLLLTTITSTYLFILQLHTEQIKQVVQEKTAQSQQLKETLVELQKTQAQLIQTEKMSSLGQLVAGIAHEINNPINFIYGNLSYINQYTQDLLELVHFYHKHYPNPSSEILEYQDVIDFDFMTDDLPRILSSMQAGADRISKIVLSLRSFSRLDESGIKLVNIHDGIDSTLLILKNKLKNKYNNLETQVIKEYGCLPLVECYVGSLNQVFMNIISNAIDAIEDKIVNNPSEYLNPAISICTEATNSDYITIKIADNGLGIKSEIKNQLFDPFFTTKAVGRGTGLGLSISYQIIVEQHKGSLWCESVPGQGTEFWIKIPIYQKG